MKSRDLFFFEKVKSGFFDTLLELSRTGGPVAAFTLGDQRFHLISEPEDVHDVFIKRTGEFIRGNVFLGLRKFTGPDNLFTTEGTDWKVQRELAHPNFTKAEIERFAAAIPGMALDFIRQATYPAGRGPIDLVDASKEFTLRIILKRLAGVEDNGKIRALLGALRDLPGDVPLFYLSKRHLPLDDAYYDRHIGPANRLLDSILGERLRNPEGGDDLIGRYVATEFVRQKSPGERRDYLRSLAMSLILAGFDSTGSGLFSSLYLVSSRPECVSAIRAEVGSVFGGRLPDCANVMSALPFTAAAVNEALRLFPPVWFLGREAVAPTQLRGFPIQPGDFVLASPYVIHRNPKRWTDPAAFRPERFLRDDFPKDCYIPFGIGPRVCVGKWMALYEIVLATAVLVQNYEISVTCEGEFELGTKFSLYPRNRVFGSFIPIRA